MYWGWSQSFALPEYSGIFVQMPCPGDILIELINAEVF